MSKIQKNSTANLDTLLIRFFGPLIWVTVIIGAPVTAVVSDHMATALFSESDYAVKMWVWGIFLVIHATYTIMLRRQLREAIDKLVKANGTIPTTGPSKAASTIASAVALALTLIGAIFLLNYYGHRGAADFATRTKAFEQTNADRAREKQRQELPQSTLPKPPPVEIIAGRERAEDNSTTTNLRPRIAQAQPQERVRSISLPLEAAQEPAKSELVQFKPIMPAPLPTPLEQAGGFLGTFGDFFGGVLNPLLTFGTLIALAITILLQRTQLDLAQGSASRNSAVMEKQAFETTFFNMLNLHNTTVQDLKFEPKTIEIPVWRNDEYDSDTTSGDSEEYEEIDYDNRNPDELLPPLNMPSAEGRQVFARVLQLMDSDLHNSKPTAVYHRIQKYHNYVLGHYFRTLYQLLELVEEYSEEAGYEEATRYSSILRAQLSANELILLFYNCGYELVDTGQFRKLLKRYEILEHMPLRPGAVEGTLDTPGYSFFIETHIHQYFKRPEDGDTVYSAPGAFGQNPVIEEYLRKYA